MAEFCRGCTEQIFGKECADKAYSEKICKEDEMLPILCEGCGEVVFIDWEGRKIKGYINE